LLARKYVCNVSRGTTAWLKELVDDVIELLGGRFFLVEKWGVEPQSWSDRV